MTTRAATFTGDSGLDSVVDTRLSAQDEARNLRLPVMIRELEIVDSRGYAKIKIVVANNELNGNGSV